MIEDDRGIEVSNSVQLETSAQTPKPHLLHLVISRDIS